jgi:hypothetical protein
MVTEPVKTPELPFEKVDIDLTAFFESTYQIFQRAEHAAGSAERSYNICGQYVKLRFAGSALPLFITPALEHLSVQSVGDPSLTVCIWDDISTNTQMPPPPWLGLAVLRQDGNFQGVYTRRGDVHGFSDHRIYTSYNWDANALSILDKKRNLALYWTYNAHRLPSYEVSAPLRTIFHWWVNQFGFQFVHSGAVGTIQGGVLLAGKGGSGKSTTALTCLNSELLYVSDDYCLISADQVPYAFCIYSSAKLNANNIHRVPHVISAISNLDRIDSEKAVFFLYPYAPAKIVKNFPIRAILLPRISGITETKLTSASPMEALKALALSTMSQLAGAGQASLQIMNRLVHQVPCYHLELGTDLSQIPDVIAGLLREQ